MAGWSLALAHGVTPGMAGFQRANAARTDSSTDTGAVMTPSRGGST